MDFLPDYLSGVAVLVSCTAFIKILTVFSILRYGLGLPDFVFGFVIMGAALLFSLLIPQGARMEDGVPFSVQAEQHRVFLAANTSSDLVAKMQDIEQKLVNESAAGTASAVQREQPSINVLSAAFLLSELKQAFELGIVLLLPFLIIDLLVVNGLALLGITQISALSISLPLKLLLFVGVDGWTLLVERLLLSYTH